MILYRIVVLTLLITVIYSTLIYTLYNEPEEQTKELEERNNYYLQLQNMTTDEIMLFKDKKEFINSIKQYDTIKYFLKGTEEENIDQLIKWYYPGYKKL